MIVAVASGKGGTGKTTLAVNLALAFEDEICLADCDVEEPNSGLFLDVKIRSREPVILPVPSINSDLCSKCRTCTDFCEYNALAFLGDDILVFDHLCRGCGGCMKFCPEGAITEIPKRIGEVSEGSVIRGSRPECGDIFFVSGNLDIGEIAAPRLIRAVQKRIPENMPTIVDCPPGTTCSMVQAVSVADYCIIVAENTPFGYHDAAVAVTAVKKLGIPLGAVINRADIGFSDLEEYFRRRDVPVLMQIPFDMKIAELYSRGIPFVREIPRYKSAFKDLLNGIAHSVDGSLLRNSLGEVRNG